MFGRKFEPTDIEHLGLPVAMRSSERLSSTPTSRANLNAVVLVAKSFLGSHVHCTSAEINKITAKIWKNKPAAQKHCTHATLSPIDHPNEQSTPH